MDDLDVSALKTIQRLLRKKIGEGLKERRKTLMSVSARSKAQAEKPASTPVSTPVSVRSVRSTPATLGEAESTEKGNEGA